MEPVQVERFYLGCLAHASYMIASEGVAAVIDPQRDVEIYLEAAAGKEWKIEHIIETHVHADFVSGHRELAERTGAHIYLGAGSGAEFPHVAVADGDEIQFGRVLSPVPANSWTHTREHLHSDERSRRTGTSRRGLYRRYSLRRRCGPAGPFADPHAPATRRDPVPQHS